MEELDDDTPLTILFKRKREPIRKKKQPEPLPEEPPEPTRDPEPATANPPLEIDFDYSVENHFKAVDRIGELCGGVDSLNANQPEINRFSDSIKFLSQWRDFKYAPKNVSFANQHNSKDKDVVGEVTLHQFSATSIPKKGMETGNGAGGEASNDFVMYVGGNVWALDWCPRVDGNSENHIKAEFVAIAAHPPESSYHKIGVPLIGRGAIQIWCLLTLFEKEDVPVNKKSRQNTPKTAIVKSNDPTDPPKKPRGRPRKQPLLDPVPPKPIGRPRKKPLIDSEQPRPKGRPRKKPLIVSEQPRPRGRPRKKPLNDFVERIDDDDQYAQPLATEYPDSSTRLHSSDELSAYSHDHNYDVDSVNTHDGSGQTDDADNLLLIAPKGKWNKTKASKNDQVHNNGLHILRKCEHGESASTLDGPLASANVSLDSPSPNKNIACISDYAADTSQNSIPNDLELPRLVLCLAHNGKVAWDMKWRPVNAHRPGSLHAMGYLAVLLGNGVLEVWEVPLPHTVKLVYPSSQKLIDPRFIQLKPVFRSSKLKCGDRQSIPLTVEWSVSSSNDMILAGCHDGVVALWKFTVTDSLTETRPLLCFSAETDPIRTLAWAPTQSDLEDANVFASAGHKGLKFWDIRDPFRPLRDHPIQGGIFGLEWLPHLRCIFGVIDDGTLWWLKLGKSAQDIPVTGKCSNLTTKSSISSLDCSSFSIWGFQASKLTGMIAYCGEDGKTLCFQPTTKSVKDPRHQVHHYLCGSLLEEGGNLVVASPSTISFSKRLPRPKNSRPAPKGKQKSTTEQMAICGNGPVEELEKDGIEELEKDGIEVFPPKTVAIHRVRWNVNRGSGRWLCYGGVAGVVRCQKVDLSILQ